MSDQVKLLDQARTMRNVARQSRSAAQKLSGANYRKFVLRYADMVEHSRLMVWSGLHWKA